MVQRVIVVLALILAIAAFFGLNVGDFGEIKELALAVGLLAVAALL